MGLNTWQDDCSPPVSNRYGRFDKYKGKGKRREGATPCIRITSCVWIRSAGSMAVQRTGFDMGQADYGDARSDITNIKRM